MKPAPFTYHRPDSVSDAIKLLSKLKDDAKVLAGGQSLVPMLKDPNFVGRGWALTQVTRGPATPAAAQRSNAKKSFFGYSLRTPRWRPRPDSAPRRKRHCG